MQLRRQYQPRDINWLLFPDLLKKYQASIPKSELKQDHNDLLVVPSFEVSTFSQQIVTDTHDEFLEFLKTSTESPKHINIKLQCYYQPGSIDPYRVTPAFFEFDWREDRVFLELARTSTRAALAFLEEFKGILQLEPAKPKIDTLQEEAESFLSRTVFIAHAFDDTGRSYAFQVTKFLNLLGFEVSTGEGFSPERVSSKVRRRLQSQEIVVVILSEKQDVTWLIQEMTGAEFIKKPIILLVENGVDFKPGVLGDLEYVRFNKGEISKCFIPILEGFRELGFEFS